MAEQDSSGIRTLTVCIATFRRAEQLHFLLGDLAGQARPPQQIVVVDNDPARSAENVVAQWRARLPSVDVVYAVQPIKNIALTRNRTIELATGDWLAFIDDDERAPPDWLKHLERTAIKYGAEGVLAPVVPIVPEHAPRWLRRGRLYGGHRMATGLQVPLSQMWIGNAFLASSRIREMDKWFDPAYGLTGGEDGDFLMRLVARGARLVWCDEAALTEPVPDTRLRLRWLLLRALRGGQNYSRHFLEGKLGGVPGLGSKVLFYARAGLQMVAAAGIAPFALLVGRHHAVRWLMRSCSNFGKLTALVGWHYREYA